MNEKQPTNVGVNETKKIGDITLTCGITYCDLEQDKEKTIIPPETAGEMQSINDSSDVITIQLSVGPVFPYDKGNDDRDIN